MPLPDEREKLIAKCAHRVRLPRKRAVDRRRERAARASPSPPLAGEPIGAATRRRVGHSVDYQPREHLLPRAVRVHLLKKCPPS